MFSILFYLISIFKYQNFAPHDKTVSRTINMSLKVKK